MSKWVTVTVIVARPMKTRRDPREGEGTLVPARLSLHARRFIQRLI